MVVSIAQIGIAAVMDKVDKLPIFGDFFELIGVAVVAAYTYRYITDPAERWVRVLSGDTVSCASRLQEANAL